MSNAAVKVGPCGGSHGSPWDDGAGFNGIRQITVNAGLCIDAIQVVYDKNGILVTGSKHGGTGGSPIEFDLAQDEYIVEVAGNYGVFQEQTIVRSLKFTTNQRTLGPVGTEEGVPFVLPVVHGTTLVGLHGRSGLYLDAIGVYLVANK